MMNSVVVQGNIVADPVLRKTGNGTSVVNLVIACQRNRKNTGRDADFIRATCWGAQADFVARSFKKGDTILIQGRLEDVRHTNREGRVYTTTEVHVFSVQFGVTKEMRMMMRAKADEAGIEAAYDEADM